MAMIISGVDRRMFAARNRATLQHVRLGEPPEWRGQPAGSHDVATRTGAGRVSLQNTENGSIRKMMSKLKT
jgi:hypothetical protein